MFIVFSIVFSMMLYENMKIWFYFQTTGRVIPLMMPFKCMSTCSVQHPSEEKDRPVYLFILKFTWACSSSAVLSNPPKFLAVDGPLPTQTKPQTMLMVGIKMCSMSRGLQLTPIFHSKEKQMPASVGKSHFIWSWR